MSWRGNARQPLSGAALLVLVALLALGLERCLSSAAWPAVRSRLAFLVGSLLLVGCSGANGRIETACAAVDRSGPALTLAARAVQSSIEGEARAECLLCSAGTDHSVCCTKAIDRAIEHHRAVYVAISDAAHVTDQIVTVTHESGVCK